MYLPENNIIAVSFLTPFWTNPTGPDGGVAQWTTHKPQERKTRVRISGFREIIAMLLFTIHLICIVCEWKREIKAFAQLIIHLKNLLYILRRLRD
jgi:hypothetical protein